MRLKLADEQCHMLLWVGLFCAGYWAGSLLTELAIRAAEWSDG